MNIKTELKAWMVRNNMEVASVAGAVKVRERTIQRLLDGETTPRDILVSELRKMMAANDRGYGVKVAEKSA